MPEPGPEPEPEQGLGLDLSQGLGLGLGLSRGYGRTDRQTDGWTNIPCILQDIAPLEPLP